jgi:hypothetical protein
MITNNSSVKWIIAVEGQRTDELKAHSSIILTESKSKSNIITLLNTWYSEEDHITIDPWALVK